MKKLVTLAVLGVAVKYFLDSESGKDIKRQIHDWLGEVQDMFSEKANAVKKEISAATPNMDQEG
jgi:hypothetical protein